MDPRGCAGYDEICDTSAVTKIALPSPQRIRDLAALSASLDAISGGGRLAIVEPDALAFGLGRMYEMLRSMSAGSQKPVSVYKSRAQAVAAMRLDPLPDIEPAFPANGDVPSVREISLSDCLPA